MLTLKECRKMYRHWTNGLYGNRIKFRTLLLYAINEKLDADTVLELNGLLHF
jgi:hypothetical protein